MTVRKKLKAIMAGKKLVLMPGAYDALSARGIEAGGFGAIVPGRRGGCWRSGRQETRVGRRAKAARGRRGHGVDGREE